MMQKTRAKPFIPNFCKGNSEKISFCLMWYSLTINRSVCKRCINFKRKGGGNYR